MSAFTLSWWGWIIMVQSLARQLKQIDFCIILKGEANVDKATVLNFLLPGLPWVSAVKKINSNDPQLRIVSLHLMRFLGVTRDLISLNIWRFKALLPKLRISSEFNLTRPFLLENDAYMYMVIKCLGIQKVAQHKITSEIQAVVFKQLFL